MYLNFVSFNLQTDLSEKAVSIQRYRSAATFIRLCGKKPGAWTCRRATIPRTQNASNTRTCVYMYKVHTLYLRFGLINHIP